MKRFAFMPPMGITTGTTLSVTGDWLGWDPKGVPMTASPDGSYAADVALPDGRHLYKFVVDGKTWYPDPSNPDREADTYGGFNSVVIIGDPKAVAPVHPTALPGGPITFPVKDIPASFDNSWIPVKYETGSLHFDQSPVAQCQLFLSAKPWALPSTRAIDDATTAFPARQIFVWLPKTLHEKPGTRFPVVYLHDGQNVWDDMSCCFGHGGWCLNKTMDDMTTIAPAILVGIPNGPARMWEYGLGSDLLNLKDTDYLKFLREIVKPGIDKEFPTLKDAAHTTVMGSSMGGLISLFAGYRNPEVFGNVVAMSTAFQIRDAKQHKLIDLLREKGRGKFRLYLDSGTGGESHDGAIATRQFVQLALSKGWRPGEDILHVEATGAEHNEEAWRKRAWIPLQFILNGSVEIPSKTN